MCSRSFFVETWGALFIDLTEAKHISTLCLLRMSQHWWVFARKRLRCDSRFAAIDVAKEYSMTDLDGLRNNETPLPEKLESIWID